MGLVLACIAPALGQTTAPVNDPFEPINRATNTLNEEWLDPLIFKPVVRIHNETLPKPARISIRNFLRNLKEPVIFENDLLQWQLERAGLSASRFAINSTVGLLGLMDIADHWGIPPHDEDFGQTLGSYGIPAGPYIVWPVIGPSSLRDSTGRIVDGLMDPLSYIQFSNRIYWDLGAEAMTILAERASQVKDEMQESDPTATEYADAYTHERSAYRQEVSLATANQITSSSAPQIGHSPAALVSTYPNADNNTTLPNELMQEISDQLSGKDLWLKSAKSEKHGAQNKLVLEVISRTQSGVINCDTIWDDLNLERVRGAVESIQIKSAKKSSASYACMKFL